jgi:hypothetical protein
VDITSAFTGLSSTQPELLSGISDLGWTVKKLKYDKKENAYVAQASNDHGESLQKTGPDETVALANLLVAVTRKHHMRSKRVSMWQTTFIDQLKAIAEAYVKAPVYDPKAAIAFKELADDCTHRAKVLGEYLEIELTPEPEPYTDVEKMTRDIRKSRKLIVSTANTEHPIWIPEQVIAFRTCFDVLGYGVANAGWDWRGDNLAFAAFAPLVSANAQEALFTEVVAQSAYVNQYRAYGPPKVALFPEFVEAAQKEEHDTGKGTHPSQSFPGVPQPGIKPFKREKDAPYPLPDHAPVHLGGVDPAYGDPNVGWSSGLEPGEPNAYLDYGDPLEFQAVMDNAKLIDTEWHMLKDGEGRPDYERMKQAVVNAFRVAILSPLKPLAFNAVHYQHLQDIPAEETNPEVYWKHLDKKRMDWNVERFGEGQRYSHRVYWPYVKPMTDIIYKMDPSKGPQGAQKETEQIIEDWLTEEEDRFIELEKEKPEERKTPSDEIERKAYNAVAQRMKLYIAESKGDMDIRESAAPAALEEEESTPFEETTVDPMKYKYAGFIAGHLKAIAQISMHVDDLLEAALKDVHEHDGEGHHFRAVALQLGIRNVNTKVASFAWLLLQPMTSQLATIDTHMMKLLGQTPADMSNRDYFKMERELATGRDAAGYGHMPLGAFQWGMWDTQRTGEGSHQDHSALKVLDPKPFEQIDWREPVNLSGKKHLQPPPPEWWDITQPAREQVGEEWDENQGSNFAKTNIPWTRVNQPVMARTAEALRVPWFTHPQTGERVLGAPGDTIMAHATKALGMSTPEVWAALAEAGKQ